MPTASVKQICKITKLWEDKGKPVRETSPKKKKMTGAKIDKKPKKKRKQRSKSGKTKPVLEKMEDLWGSDQSRSQLAKASFPVPTPVDGN